ncbi:hypothetical protein QFZ68_002159 [Streptomyces sp. V1I6]|nr:hypothetical protein [Streptomyces sp. V1I6]
MAAARGVLPTPPLPAASMCGSAAWVGLRPDPVPRSAVSSNSPYGPAAVGGAPRRADMPLCGTRPVGGDIRPCRATPAPPPTPALPAALPTPAGHFQPRRRLRRGGPGAEPPKHRAKRGTGSGTCPGSGSGVPPRPPGRRGRGGETPAAGATRPALTLRRPPRASDAAPAPAPTTRPSPPRHPGACRHPHPDSRRRRRLVPVPAPQSAGAPGSCRFGLLTCGKSPRRKSLLTCVAGPRPPAGTVARVAPARESNHGNHAR